MTCVGKEELKELQSRLLKIAYLFACDAMSEENEYKEEAAEGFKRMQEPIKEITNDLKYGHRPTRLMVDMVNTLIDRMKAEDGIQYDIADVIMPMIMNL